MARKEDGVAKQQPRKKAPTVPKPEPPKPPRSAFMCFSDSKKREIMIRHGIVEVSEPRKKPTPQLTTKFVSHNRSHLALLLASLM